MKIETIGNATLYCADVRDALPLVSGAAVLCTDPPYLLTTGGHSRAPLEGGFGGWMADYGNGGDIVPCDVEFTEWAPLVFAALGERAQAYVMTNGRNLKDMQVALEAAGFRLHTILVWDKRTALPNKYYQNVTEFTLFMFKGKARTIKDPSSKNLISIFQRDESEHPTEKPVALMEHYITNSTDPGGLVLDPFMGSGTTGVAAIRTGRKFIGIEKNERFFEMSCERIAAARPMPGLFGTSRARSVEKTATFL